MIDQEVNTSEVQEVSTKVAVTETEVDFKTSEKKDGLTSIADETITEDGQQVKVLTVKTSNGEFLGNKRTSSSVVPEKTNPDIILSTASSDSVKENQVVAKKIAEKEPKNRNDDPFLGDWLFEYPK